MLQRGGVLFLCLLLNLLRVYCLDPDGGSNRPGNGDAIETNVNEFPMVVGLVNAAKKNVYCGGTIITNRWVLTSAFCLEDEDVTNIGVLYGAHNHFDAHATLGIHGLLRLKQMVKHPLAREFYNDIGLAETEKSIPFNEHVGPACLPFPVDNQPCAGQSVQAVGWGTWYFDRKPTVFLRKIRLKIVHQSLCTFITGQVASSRIICTYPVGKHVECQYDFGAPLLWEGRNKRVYVVGITAGSFGCAANNYPGIHTRIEPFVGWIKDTTGAEDHCKSSISKYKIQSAIDGSLLAFLYGHVIGWSSAAVPQLQEGILPEGPVSQANSGWVGGALCLGALLSSPLHGLLADAKGRKFAAYLVGVAFLVNWSFMYAAQSLWCVLVARFIAGIGAAGSITVVSIYNNEVAEPRLKSSLGGLLAMLYALGILCAYILGAWVPYSHVVVIYLGATLLFLPAWWFMPESPAHLVLHGNDKEALRVLQWLLGFRGSFAQDAFDRLKREQAGAGKPATIAKFLRDPSARRGITLAIVMLSVQTFCGLFAIHSYAGSILSRSGGGLTPTVGTILYGSLMVAGGIVPPIIADKMPRKVLLGISSGFLAAGMAVLGTFQYLQTQGLDISEPGSFLGTIPAVALSVSVFFYYIGLGSVIYITIVELFTDETRGVAGVFVALTIWSTSFILLQFFGVAVEAFGDHSVFFFFSAVCIFGLLFICIFVPETRGKSVEEIVAILGKR